MQNVLPAQFVSKTALQSNFSKSSVSGSDSGIPTCRNKPSKSEVLTSPRGSRVKTLGTTRSVPRMPTANGQDAVNCRQMSCASDVVIAVSFLATLLPFLAWLLAFAYIVHRAQRTSTSDATAPTPSAVDDSIEYAEKDGECGPDGSCSDQSWVDGSEASDADVEFARPGEPSSNNKAGSKERKRDVRTTRRPYGDPSPRESR